MAKDAKVGDDSILYACRGDMEVYNIYAGDTVVWPAPPAASDCRLQFVGNAHLTIRAFSEEKVWDGRIETSVDNGATWQEFLPSSVVEDTGSDVILMRGTGNTILSAGNEGEPLIQVDTTSGFYVHGKIESMLDWQSVAAGVRPTPAEGAFASFFAYNTQLVRGPDLSTLKLTKECLNNFYVGCENLEYLPRFNQKNIPTSCMVLMFGGCKKLGLYESYSASHHYSFRVPADKEGTGDNLVMTWAFVNADGEVRTPQINTIYYTGNPVM